MSGPIILPFVTTYDDKGAKKADVSLKGLMKTQLAGAVSVGVLVRELGKAVNAYAEDQKGQELLKVAVQNSTGATDLQVAALEGSIAKMEMSAAISDDLLRPAMGNLVRATKDVKEAQDLMGIALDISAAKGLDVVTVSNALSKASLGQYGALKKLGIGLDENAVKAGDFNTIATDLKYTFEGASDAAANSAAGGFAKFKIAVDNIYETVGAQLGPKLGEYATLLAGLSTKTIDVANKSEGWTGKIKDLVTNLFPAVAQLKMIDGLITKLSPTQDTATKSARNLTRQFSAFERAMMSSYENGLKPTKEELDKLKAAQDKADAAAKRHAKTLKEQLTTRLREAAAATQLLEDNFNSMRDGFADSLTGMVSLSDAVKTQEEADSNLTNALKARSEAYTALAKLNPTEDAKAYADALLDVAAAETAVSTATANRANADYSKVFSDQIEKAKHFAQNLEALINQGLGKDGLAQLINLGPVVGAQVTQEMLTGVSGITVGSLNTSMASLAGTANRLGVVGANAFLGTAGAPAATSQVYNINVNAGIVSNPAQVGREVIDAILLAQKTSGQVFVTIGAGIGTL